MALVGSGPGAADAAAWRSCGGMNAGMPGGRIGNLVPVSSILGQSIVIANQAMQHRLMA